MPPTSDCGAFVSIFHDGELRGCLGRLNSPLPIDSPLPIARLVAQLAQAVADSDPRFDRVTPQELAGIGLEISVLTPEREIQSVEEIEVGTHGLIVEQGTNRGLLLPQVPGEHGWDRDTFLDHTCVKAGLAAGRLAAWRALFVFEARSSARTHVDMDNVCHTLVGAACGAAGLNRRTRFGAATLMISANIPDVDVLVFASGSPWIEFRRGWTHGILAQIVLPLALTGFVWLFDRFRRARGSEGERPFHPGWTLAARVRRRLLACLPRLPEQLRRASL